MSSIIDIPRDRVVVGVHTTSGRGFTPEEIAERCVARLVQVSETAPPAIREQALAYKADIEKVVLHYMRQAVASDRTTMYNVLADGGHIDAAELIRRI